MNSVVRFVTKLTHGMIYEIDTGVDVLPKEARAANPSKSPVKHALKRRSVVLWPALTVRDVLN
ncbi:hypothetical protein N7449_005754 [Penicillium cf. viridicatum]|uniref:Uncharacterized protein n=1 Tax=Penicillium cf. viridicatum TaxID=2972119 RepID=A0A9W9MGP4_9EURO|nr:hypothetical protein N7449_005754 [Penicillium cf. viridicatum]